MDWNDLVTAVAELTDADTERLLEAARAQRSAQSSSTSTAGAAAVDGAAEPTATAVDPQAGAAESTSDQTAGAGSQPPTPPAAPEAPAAPVAEAPAGSSDVPPPDVSRPGAGVATPSPLDSVFSTTGPDTELTGMPHDDAVPTLAQIREKIEGRSARAVGQTELDALRPEVKSQAESEEERAKAAREVLEKIRASMNRS